MFFYFQRCFHSSDTNCGDRAGFMQGHCNVKSVWGNVCLHFTDLEAFQASLWGNISLVPLPAKSRTRLRPC